GQAAAIAQASRRSGAARWNGVAHPPRSAAAAQESGQPPLARAGAAGDGGRRAVVRPGPVRHPDGAEPVRRLESGPLYDSDRHEL
ncbi:MAG: hypothetical protein AVDCRST_MAG62-336, partial [uncultured Sphingomonas sp.]